MVPFSQTHPQIQWQRTLYVPYQEYISGVCNHHSVVAQTTAKIAITTECGYHRVNKHLEGAFPKEFRQQLWQLQRMYYYNILYTWWNDERLTTLLGKKLILPTFPLEHLVEMLASFLPSEVVKEENLTSFHVYMSNWQVSTLHVMSGIEVKTPPKCSPVGSPIVQWATLKSWEWPEDKASRVMVVQNVWLHTPPPE